MKAKPFLVDNSLGELLYKRFGYKYDRTKKLHNDFWYIWAKSGLLDFVCLRMRSKYKIPVLREKKDFISGEISMGYDSVVLDTHAYYDKWKDKEKFRKELESIIVQLRLHRSTYWFLFNKIFYNIPLRIREKWEGFDTEAEFGLTIPLDNSPMVGFTKGEIVEIHKIIVTSLKSKSKRMLTAKELASVDSWCGRLERNVRIWKDKKLIYLVVEQMKKYKKLTQSRDDKGDTSDNVLQTSSKCVANIVAELPDNIKYIDATVFRQIVKRLYKSFPILREYVAQG